MDGFDGKDDRSWLELIRRGGDASVGAGLVRLAKLAAATEQAEDAAAAMEASRGEAGEVWQATDDGPAEATRPEAVEAFDGRLLRKEVER